MNKKITKKEQKKQKVEEENKKILEAKKRKIKKIKRIAMRISILLVIVLVITIVVIGIVKSKSESEKIPLEDIVEGVNIAIIGNQDKKLDSVTFDSKKENTPENFKSLDTVLISSKSELDKFVEDMLKTEGVSVTFDEKASLMKSLPKYTSSYFRNNDLAVVSIQAPKLSTIYKKAVWSDENRNLSIQMEITKPEIGVSEIGNFLVLLDVNKKCKSKTAAAYYIDK